MIASLFVYVVRKAVSDGTRGNKTRGSNIATATDRDISCCLLVDPAVNLIFS